MSNKFQKRASIHGLVVTRKEGEMIAVNRGEILIEIVEIKGKYVRLAFKAHREISIHRAEGCTDEKSDTETR